MASFDNKQKLKTISNQLNSNNIVFQQKLIKEKELNENLSQHNRDLSTNKIILDLSSDWTLVNYIEHATGKDSIINSQVIFDRLDIKWIPFIRISMIYAFGNPLENKFLIVKNTNLINQYVGHDNKFIQLIDIINEEDDEVFKKVVINTSWSVSGNQLENSNNESPMYIKILIQFINPKEYI